MSGIAVASVDSLLRPGFDSPHLHARHHRGPRALGALSTPIRRRDGTLNRDGRWMGNPGCCAQHRSTHLGGVWRRKCVCPIGGARPADERLGFDSPTPPPCTYSLVVERMAYTHLAGVRFPVRAPWGHRITAITSPLQGDDQGSTPCGSTMSGDSTLNSSRACSPLTHRVSSTQPCVGT